MQELALASALSLLGGNGAVLQQQQQVREEKEAKDVILVD
jgi:hypothetical protein